MPAGCQWCLHQQAGSAHEASLYVSGSSTGAQSRIDSAEQPLGKDFADSGDYYATCPVNIWETMSDTSQFLRQDPRKLNDLALALTPQKPGRDVPLLIKWHEGYWHVYLDAVVVLRFL